MEISTINSIIIGSVATVTAFLFGKSGILTKWSNSRLSRLEISQKKEDEKIDSYKNENEKLHLLVDTLNQKVSQLEKDLTRTTDRLNILVAYFDKINPDGDTFIDKIMETAKTKV